MTVASPTEAAAPQQILPPPAMRPVRSIFTQAIYDTFGKTGARIGFVWVVVLVLLAVFAPVVANSRPILAKVDGALTSPMLKGLAPTDVLLLITFFSAVVMLLVSTRVKCGIAQGVGIVASVGVVSMLPLFWKEIDNNLWLLAGEGTADWWIRLRGSLDIGVVRTVILLLGLLPFGLLLFGWMRYAPSPVKWLGVAFIVLTLPTLAFVFFPLTESDNVVYNRWRDMAAAGELEVVVPAPIPFSPNDRLRDVGDAQLVPPFWSVGLHRWLGEHMPHALGFDGPGKATLDKMEEIPTNHWLGTTVFGEDMLSRMIHACRIALAIGLIATGISTVIGVILGAAMGYFAGWIDLLLMRVVEIVEAVPRLIVLLIVMTFFGKNIWYMMIAYGLIAWTSDAKFIRAEFLSLRKQDFVQAAQAMGLPLKNVLFKHMLPNGIAPVLVNISFGIAGAILLESVLSFLGLGLEAKDPSWGQLLNQARTGGTGFNWWIATFPGLAIFLTVFAYILIGEAMRDALDPKLREAE